VNLNDTIRQLHSLLKPIQQEMFKSFYSYSGGLKYVIHCSRRLGKTYLLCVLSVITAISKSNANVRYASVTQKSVKKMIHPIMKKVFANLPPDYKGKWNGQEGAYIFKNGSMIHVAGVNNGHADDLRGTEADLCVVDEGSFIDSLDYLVESVLTPQLITTNGKLIMASSSPLSPAHQFASYIHQAKANGFYVSYDINQGGYSQATVDLFLKESGGPKSTTARREYFNELIVDSEMAIIPEWSHRFVQTIQPDEFRKFYHNYSSADWGVRDKTAILWAYYDFKKAKLIIEDEFTVSGEETTTRLIATTVKEKELTLGYSKLYRRPADNNNLLVLQDMSNDYDLHYSPTNKETLAAMVNEVRLMVQDGRIIVHPRCKQLIGCLEFGVYQDQKRKEFGRSKEFGHYDALASLIYLVRNLDTQTNPIPRDHNYTQNTFDPNLHLTSDSELLNFVNKRINHGRL